jgi:hypothetical protein
MSLSLAFQWDSEWPPWVFNVVKRGSSQVPSYANRYSGPYNSLLYYCIGASDILVVDPQVYPPERSDGPIDLVSFIVYGAYNWNGPVLFVDIKDESQAEYTELCNLADAEMRNR